MCVILDFSGDSSKPLSIRNSVTKGMISSVMTSLLTAVITKSSAYRMKFTFARSPWPESVGVLVGQGFGHWVEGYFMQCLHSPVSHHRNT